MEYTTDLLEILNNIDPSLLDYQEWCKCWNGTQI